MDWHISSSQWKSMMSDGSLVWQIFRLLVLSPSTFWDRKRIKMKRSSLQLSKMKQVKHGCGGWITPTILTNIRVGGTSRGALLLLQELGFLVNCCWSSSGTMKSTANIAGSSGSTVFWGFCTYINLELSNTIFPICSTAVSLVPQPTCKVKWGPCRHCC